MAGDTETMVDRQQRLERAIGDYLESLDAGRAPDPGHWLACHPDLQPELGLFLADQAHINGLIGPVRLAVAGDEGDTTRSLNGSADLAETQGSSPDRTRPAGETTERPPGPEPPDRPGPPPGGGDADGSELPRGARVRYFGDYELRSVLGQGGMGVVYRARQLSLNRTVALKMIKAGALADDAELRRFHNEAEAVAQLDHPGIVPIHEVGEHQGQRYFSMKLVEGGSLAAALGRYRDDLRAVARLVAGVARAVHHAHQRGILHRDLKPANILVDAEGRPHVTDFGLARRIEGDSEMTQSGAIMGTPGYMAPEQAEGRRRAITTATDVYGLGAVLYACLTGHAPFEGDSVIEVLDQVRHRPPQRPGALNPRVGRDPEVICLRCLEKDPGRRYDSAAALADDLERYLRGEPILARPIGPWTRAAMWCRRKPGLAALWAALLVALISGFAGVTWQWREAVHQRNLLAIEQKKTAQERDQKEAERKAAEVARQEAQARLGLALEAIRTYYTGVSKDMMLKEPRMTALRDKLLKMALDFYKRLQESLKDNPDPKAQADLAEAYYNVGGISREVRSMREAEQAFEQALAIRERLAAADPTNDDYQRDLATSLTWPREDGRALARALAIRERLAAAHPDVVRDQIDLASSLAYFPSTPEGARAIDIPIVDELRRNGERLKAMVSAYPDVPEIRRNLADVHRWLGVKLYLQGDIEGSLRSYRDSQLDLEGITTPLTDVDRWQLGLAHDGVGSALRSLGRPAEALPALRKAVEVRERSFTNYPAHPIARLDLGSSLSELGDLQRELGLLAQAGETLRRSRAIHEDLARDYPVFKHLLIGVDISLGRLEGALGRTAEAIRVLSRAVTLWEELVAGMNHSNKDDDLNINIMRGVIGACDALIEVRGPIEPMLAARALLDRLDREGRLGSVAQREVLTWLDIRIAKAQRQAGRSAEARETIRRAESEMEIYRRAGLSPEYTYNLAGCYALLSTLVGRPGITPSPAEQAEIRANRDRAMDELRRALGAGYPWSRLLGDHDLDSLRDRPDFQDLMCDLAFPADPFAR